MTKGITTLLTQFKEAQRELRSRLEAEGETLLKESFKELFDKHKGLKVFVFVGSTPSFNDGEACEHRGESYIGDELYLKPYFDNSGKYWCDSWDDKEELDEFFVENIEDFNRGDVSGAALQPILVNRHCETLGQAFADIKDFEDAVEMVYHTNYQVVVQLEDDDSISLTHEEYDCGY